MKPSAAVKAFLREEFGQTTVEYLLIVAVIVVVISVLGKGFQSGVRKVTDSVFAGINAKIDELMKNSL
jgi:Flp pilus assembly pilin Flp